MKKEYFEIDGIPAVIYGEKSERVWLFVHGQGGNMEEAGDFANTAVPLAGAGNRPAGAQQTEKCTGLCAVAGVGGYTPHSAVYKRAVECVFTSRKQHRCVFFNAGA